MKSKSSRISLLAASALAALGAARGVTADCPSDLNASGAVDGGDLALMLSGWGGAAGDVTGDGTTDGSDLAALLSGWGDCPPEVEWDLVSRLDATTTTAYDTAGAVTDSWAGTGVGASVAYFFPDGRLVRPSVYPGGSFNGGGKGGRVQVFNAAGAVENTLVLATSTMWQHHDVCPMPNGNILCIVWDLHTQAEGLAAGRTGLATAIWSEMLLEIRPTGGTTYEVVWQWKLWNHLIQDANSALGNFGVVSAHPELVDINLGTINGGDWVHMNAVDYDATRDEIVVSSRALNEVWVIDHSTSTAEAATHTGGRHGHGGDILWRWGNPQNYDRGTAANQVFYVVHSATWIDQGMPGAGNVLAFNNGDRAGTTNDYSTVVELAPPRDPADNYITPATGAFGPAAPAWSVGGVGGFYGGPTQCGAFRTLDNTTLITLTNSGTLFEVNSAGATIATRTLTGQVARVPRYRLVNGLWQGH